MRATVTNTNETRYVRQAKHLALTYSCFEIISLLVVSRLHRLDRSACFALLCADTRQTLRGACVRARLSPVAVVVVGRHQYCHVMVMMSLHPHSHHHHHQAALAPSLLLLLLLALACSTTPHAPRGQPSLPTLLVQVSAQCLTAIISKRWLALCRTSSASGWRWFDCNRPSSRLSFKVRTKERSRLRCCLRPFRSLAARLGTHDHAVNSDSTIKPSRTCSSAT